MLLLTLTLSFVIRIYQLTQNPEGFDQTEAAFAYNAYSIFKTGRDEYGKLFPLVLTSIGDYKLAGYSYWQIPFIAIFGLNEFSARLSTVTAGMISLILIYYIVNQTLKKRKLALLTLFFTGVSPWHIILSRMAYDPMIALMFFLASILLFIKWYTTERLYLLLISALALCWAIATYYAVWVILPFILIFYFIYILKKPGRKTSFWLTMLILLLPVLMLIKLLLITHGQRLNQDSTYQVHAYPLLLEQIMEDQHEFPLPVTRVFHNKLTFYPQFLLQNLFNNLSFDFLFLRGDKMDRRFSVPYHGVLYLWAAPFVLLGLLYFVKNHSLYKNTLVLGTILIVFLGSSFSEFGSETERTIFAIPLFCFLISYGLISMYRNLRPNPIFTLLLSCAGLLLVYNVAYFNHQYYWHANVHEPWGRDFGVHEMILSLPTLKEKYQKIVIPDSSYIFYYLYNKVDPKTAWAESGVKVNKKNFLGLHLRSNIGDHLAMPIECPAAGKLNVVY
ncbi:MAG: glycosyltransferase family 39 protein, partial [Patescibacteria group bacterium]